MPKVSEEYKERRKKEIILHAKSVFQRKGFEPTTMTDIKEEAGISFGGLYMYFSNTEEIFTQLLQLEKEEEQLQAAPADRAWNQVKSFIEHQKEELRTNRDSLIPATYEYIVTSWREEHRLPFLEARFKKAAEDFRTILQAGIRNGEFKPTVPEGDLSKLVITTIEGLHINSLFLEEQTADFEGQLDALQKLLEKALDVRVATKFTRSRQLEWL